MDIVRSLLSLCLGLFPALCALCGRPSAARGVCSSCLPVPVAAVGRCPRCFERADGDDPKQPCMLCQTLPSPITTQRYLWEYSGACRRLIHSIKFGSTEALCRDVASTLAAALPTLFPCTNWDLITFVPASASQASLRGFDQGQTLAESLAQFAPTKDILRPAKNRSIPQSQRSISERFRTKINFRASRALSGKRILVVDDVVTTGLSVSAAALALRHAGANSVDVLSLARAPRWGSYRQAVARRVRGCIAQCE